MSREHLDERHHHRLHRAAELDPHTPRFDHDLVRRRATGPQGDDVVEDTPKDAGEGDAGEAGDGHEADDEEDEGWFREGIGDGGGRELAGLEGVEGGGG